MARDINKLVAEEIKRRHLAQSSLGGKATLEKHGTEHFQKLSKKGLASRLKRKKLSTKKVIKQLAK